MLKELILATMNRGKAKEFEELLKHYFNSILSLVDINPQIEIEEAGSTFRENALLKARRVLEKTGVPTLADDSGLEVDVLAGRPGVCSSRFAGPGARDFDNIAKLLLELEGVENRNARFVCCLALVFPDGKEIVVEGYLRGVIAREPTGKGGFGYDPVFFIPEKNMTMAELPTSEKNLISHRGRATRALVMYLAGHRNSRGNSNT